jgi:hypothetical protein
MMQKQPSQSLKPSAAPSSLPPIMPIGQQLGMSAQSKAADPKTVRSMAPSANNSNPQKKRKKYRMNYVQQRAVQNSEGVMRAYGVPKTFGSTAESKQGEGLLLARNDGSKVSTGLSSVGITPSVGQYQVC